MKIIFIKTVKSVYLWLFLLAIINLLIAFYFVGYPLILNGDAPSYLNAMKLLQGQDYDHNSFGSETDLMVKTRVLTTPLMLYGSILAGRFWGGEYAGMFFINLIFYFLIIFVFYRLVLSIYKNQLVAFLAAILFFTNYCFINYGVTYRTDMGGWLFFLLAAWLAVEYFKDQSKKKFFYFSVLASSVGLLFKEYGALGLTVLGVLILFMPLTPWQKIKKLFQAGIMFWVLPIIYYLFVFWQFNFSYLDRYLFAISATINNPEQPGINWSLLLLVKVLSWLFLVGWSFFAFGLFQEYKNFNWERLKILIAFLPASLSFLAWPGLTQRIAFVFVPLLAMISGFGLSKIKNKYFIFSLIIIYVFINYWIRNLSIPDLMHLINI